MHLNNNVSLQINLAPGDYPHVRHILPHQLKVLAGQVDEVILTVDTRPGKGRFSEGWNKYAVLLNEYLHNEIRPLFPVKIIPVDYADDVRTNIARHFFGTRHIPEKDFRGGPFYGYFFGLFSATHNLVFHLDSDMFLGGGSKNWIQEACTFFKNDASCLIVSPLPGPPQPNGKLIDQSIINKLNSHTYQLDGMSTRVFMINKTLFEDHKLALDKPGPRNQVKALVQGNPNADLPEHLILAFMKKHQLKRIDFLGTGTGIWSLHPPYRTAAFYENLPALVKRIETNDLPVAQQGFYDIIDEVCDWTEAREKIAANRWWKPYLNTH